MNCAAQRYAHLIDLPLRAGGNAVGEMLKPGLKVVGGRENTRLSTHGVHLNQSPNPFAFRLTVGGVTSSRQR